MSRIRSSDTSPELLLRKSLWQVGLRYRLKAKLLGRPDLVFPQYKTVIFVDGCYWHGCPKHLTWPKNNAAFWRAKILENKLRDATVTRTLKRDGWTVIRVWEHEIRQDLVRCVSRLAKKIRAGLPAKDMQ